MIDLKESLQFKIDWIVFGVNVDPGGGQLVGETEFLPPYLLSAQSLGVPAISRGR